MAWRKPRTAHDKDPLDSGTSRRSSSLPRTLWAVCIALAVASSGCHKARRPLSAAQIHAITRELATAASSVPNSEVRVDLSASDPLPDSRDRLSVTLRTDVPDASSRATVTTLLQSLGRVATRHGLTQDPQAETREGLLFNYSRAGHPTHTVHIHLVAAAAANKQTRSRQGPPRLAIILDDLGSDRAAADAIFALPYALTISVLPNQPHSADIAATAHSRGFEVMLHLPMESMSNGKAESQELRPGMSARDVSSLVNQFVQAVPGAIGINNHQGSQSTADPALMSELMQVLRDRNLFYVDSRTTTATVAYDAARQAGVRAGFRNVPFLDDVAELPAVRKQLHLALRGAKQKGEAIAIGHPHRATLAALKEILPQANAEGISLVFASDLVH